MPRNAFYTETNQTEPLVRAKESVFALEVDQVYILYKSIAVLQITILQMCICACLHMGSQALLSPSIIGPMKLTNILRFGVSWRQQTHFLH